jgi:membrane-associated phospholipid phosphatase
MTREAATLLALLTVAARPLAAQSDTARVPLVARREVVALSAFTATSLALLPFDRRLGARIAWNPARPGSGGRLADRVATIGDPGSVIVAGGALLLGYGLHRPHLADVGRHLSEAVVVSGTLTAATKALVGRARPRTAGLEAPFVFTPLRPAGGHVSYPSGHTSAAFSIAAVLDRELARSSFAARHQRWTTAASVGLYATAAGVGAARVVQRAHWTSDVVAGAGLGIASGWWAVRWHHVRRGTARSDDQMRRQ